jgi:4-amino-4-deoxy-L-arabinose transferase-like glycosyltransferase
MEMFVVGETLQKDARHDFSDSWKRAIYANPEANNHVLCTIETRLVHKLWRVMHGDRNVPFSEAWLRFPAFLWGMLGIGLAGYLGALLGGTRMGLATAAVLAIHPWAVRFSTETRGYSAALACLLLVMLCLHQLIVQRKNDWRWWATLALALCLGMLAYLTSAVVVAGLEIVAVVVLLRRRDWRRLAWLMAANVLAATVFLDLYSPSIFQVSAFLKEKASGHLAPISLAWWQDVASAFTCGEDWHRGYLGMETMPWWQRGGLFVGCYGLTMVGLWQMWRRGGTAVRVCALAWLLAVAMMLLQNVLAKQAMLTWYLCPLLPGMALSMGFGLSGEGRKSRALTAALSLIWLASLAPFLGQLVSSPRQPVRDAAQMIKTRWPTAVVAYFGLTDQHVDAYLPTVRVQDRRESDEIDWIKNLQVEANTTHQPMVVWYGGNQEARSPQTMHYLHGQGFQEVARLHGVDEMYDMFVLFQSVAPGGIPLSGASDDRH